MFNLFGYAIKFAWADTIWVSNTKYESLGQREDHFIHISRTYVRDMKLYMYDITIWKFKVLWAKI